MLMRFVHACVEGIDTQHVLVFSLHAFHRAKSCWQRLSCVVAHQALRSSSWSAGITVYDPLKHWKAGEDHVKNVGIVGGGGLGHMGIKLAKALGATVTAITHSPNKVRFL